MSKTTEETNKWNDYIDNLIDIMDNIELHKVTILTGRNGGGKSMIRKLMPQFLRRKAELNGKRFGIASTSMDDRAGVDPNRMMVFTRDCEWLPTGENTVDAVLGVLKSKEHFLILDEIELGMGEELQLGLAEAINEKLDEALKNNLGVMVITHSRIIAKYVKHDNFVNLEGMTEDEWINREIKPRSVEDFKKDSNALYCAFDKRLKTSN